MLDPKISEGALSRATITVTVSDDFESSWIATQDDGTTKWECNMPDYDPETKLPFTSKEEVEPTLKEKLLSNPNYWAQYRTAAEWKTINTPDEVIEVRRKRDELLNKYEWTVNSPDLTDSKKAEWKTYRQALRDLPDQSGFPWEADGLTWPTKPTS
tara:strand:+ start:3161 stop:3628 length:468 start_codon:yes stop_codon:yes gene_type:complete